MTNAAVVICRRLVYVTSFVLPLNEISLGFVDPTMVTVSSSVLDLGCLKVNVVNQVIDIIYVCAGSSSSIVSVYVICAVGVSLTSDHMSHTPSPSLSCRRSSLSCT